MRGEQSDYAVKKALRRSEGDEGEENFSRNYSGLMNDMVAERAGEAGPVERKVMHSTP